MPLFAQLALYLALFLIGAVVALATWAETRAKRLASRAVSVNSRRPRRRKPISMATTQVAGKMSPLTTPEKLIIRRNTFLKPFVEQSAITKDQPYRELLRPLGGGDVYDLHQHKEIAGHHMVIISQRVQGVEIFSYGFIYADDCEIRVRPNVETVPADAAAAKLNIEEEAIAAPVVPDPAAVVKRDWESYAHPDRPDYPSFIDLSKNDFPARIVKYMMAHNWRVHTGLRERNIVYFEGASLSGIPNADAMDRWNDFRSIISFDEDGYPYFALTPTQATTEPGWKYTASPLNKNGAFRIALGQHHDGWVHGTHGWGGGAHDALVQVGLLGHYRDKNKDGFRTGDKFYRSDDNAVNQHWSYTDASHVGRSSAGCLVGLSHHRHNQFITLLKRDPRYLSNRWHRYDTTVVNGRDFHFSEFGYG